MAAVSPWDQFLPMRTYVLSSGSRLSRVRSTGIQRLSSANAARAGALRRDERLARARRMHRRGAHAPVLDVRDDDGVERDAATEVERAVDRIDDPEALGPLQRARRGLLGEHRDRRIVRRERRDDRLLRGVIRSRGEVRPTALACDDADICRDDRVADRHRGACGERREVRVSPRGCGGYAGQSLWTLARRSLRSKGFATTSPILRSLNSRSKSAVAALTKSTGMFFTSGSARTRSNTSIPESPGIMTSRMRRSACTWRTVSSTTAPSGTMTAW